MGVFQYIEGWYHEDRTRTLASPRTHRTAVPSRPFPPCRPGDMRETRAPSGQNRLHSAGLLAGKGFLNPLRGHKRF